MLKLFIICIATLFVNNSVNAQQFVINNKVPPTFIVNNKCECGCVETGKCECKSCTIKSNKIEQPKLVTYYLVGNQWVTESQFQQSFNQAQPFSSGCANGNCQVPQRSFIRRR